MACLPEGSSGVGEATPQTLELPLRGCQPRAAYLKRGRAARTSAPEPWGVSSLIAPYRENRKQRRYADGRTLRRYKRRWIVERTNSWLGQFRRLLVRHEHLLSTYLAFFYLACFWITLRHCL